MAIHVQTWVWLQNESDHHSKAGWGVHSLYCNSYHIRPTLQFIQYMAYPAVQALSHLYCTLGNLLLPLQVYQTDAVESMWCTRPVSGTTPYALSANHSPSNWTNEGAWALGPASTFTVIGVAVRWGNAMDIGRENTGGTEMETYENGCIG